MAVEMTTERHMPLMTTHTCRQYRHNYKGVAQKVWYRIVIRSGEALESWNCIEKLLMIGKISEVLIHPSVRLLSKVQSWRLMLMRSSPTPLPKKQAQRNETKVLVLCTVLVSSPVSCNITPYSAHVCGLSDPAATTSSVELLVATTNPSAHGVHCLCPFGSPIWQPRLPISRLLKQAIGQSSNRPEDLSSN